MITSLRWRTAAALLAVAPNALAAQTWATRIDSIFANQRGTDRPGCAVGVVQAGKLIFARGYGMADLAQGLAITPQSIFHVASVSKQFTATSLALLAQSGRISLDDDIRKYIPELPVYEAPITIRRLLQHTSGIRDQWNLLIAGGWRLGDDLITEQDVLDIVSRQKVLNFPPGSDWSYSNTGFSLAAIVVKRVTGRSLREYADSALFQPLGMTRTHFHDDNHHIVSGRTRGHTYEAGEWKETVPNYSTVGATSLFTTVVDLARWHRQLDSGLVGGRRLLDEIFRPAVLTSGDTLRYGLGISVRGVYRGVPTVSHSGGDPGYSSHLLHFPATGSGVSVLCNSSGVANPVRLAELTADAALANELGAEPTPPAPVPAATISGLEGLYWSESLEAVARLAVDSGVAVWRAGVGLAGGTRLRETGTAGQWWMGAGPGTVTRRPDGTVLIRTTNGEAASWAKVADWTPTAADRAALVGRYWSPEVDAVWEIRAAGDTLLVHRRKFAPTRLTPVFKDTYISSGGGFGVGLVRAVRGKDGRVNAFLTGSGRVRRLRFERITESAPLATAKAP